MNDDTLRRVGAAMVAGAFLGVLVPRVAPADEAADRKAEAQRLFMQGQAALEKGDNQSGCALMRQSLGLFAVANTLFNVARCDEADGKLVSALEHWKRGLSLIDAKDKRTPVVQKSIETLEPRIPRVRIVIPPKQAPLVVLVDDEEVPAAKLDAPLFVDPGKHVIVARKEGRKDKRVELLLNEKERTEVVAEPGELLASGPGPSPSATATSTGSAAPPPPPPPGGSGLRTGGFVALGVGAVGVIGAAVTGGMILSNYGTIKESCPDNQCSGAVPAEVASQKTLLAVNAAAWGVGIAGVAAGTLMLVLSKPSGTTEPAKAEIVPVFVPGGGGIGLSGRF